MSRTYKIMLAILAALISARLALPFITKGYINKKLKQVKGYDARVGDVSMSLIGGSVGLHDLTVVDTSSSSAVRHFYAKKVGVDFQWSPLLKKTLIARMRIDEPSVDFSALPEKKKEEKPDVTLEEAKDKVQEGVRKTRRAPDFNIEEIRLVDGKLSYHDFNRTPQVHLEMDQIQGYVLNATNNMELAKASGTELNLRARVPKTGSFKLGIWAAPFERMPTFNFKSEVMDLDLTECNDLMLAYGDFDVKQGEFNLATEFAAAQGRFKGYIKPTIDNLEVINWEKDKHHPVRLLKKALVGTPAAILSNQYRDRLGIKVPLKGRFNDPETQVWTAIGSLLKNAFIEALFPGVEGSITFEEVKEG